MNSPIERRCAATVPSDGPDCGYKFYCRLFDDMIRKGLCLLRRRELNGKDGFSCTGCSKDTILNSLRRRRPSLRP